MFAIISAIAMIVFLMMTLVGVLGGDTNDVAAWIGVIGFLLFFVALVCTLVAASLENEANDDRAQALSRRVAAACYPSVVTNRVTSDSKIVFDCANDGKLRVIRDGSPR